MGKIVLKKDDEFIEEWKGIREKGKLNYFLTINKYFIILFVAVIIISFLFAAIVSAYTKIKIFNIQLIKKTVVRFFLIIAVLVISSYLKWKKDEKKYNQLTNKDSK